MLLPLMLTSIAVVIDYDGDVTEVSEYDMIGLCHLNNFYVRLVFYVTPSVISFVMAISLMFFTLHR